MQFAPEEKRSLMSKLTAIRRLSRWRQHVPFTLPLVIIGAILGAQQAGTVIDFRLVFVVLANVLAMTYAFMINDVVDAPDDARDPVKAERNVISRGLLGFEEAQWISRLIFIASAVLFWMGGTASFVVGMSSLVLSHLYSAPPLRLKARPLVDVVSHVLFLSTLIMVSGYVLYDVSLSPAWWVILGVTFASAYGQFYNQLDDFDVDEQAGLKNTAMLIGKRMTIGAMYAAAALTVLSIGVAVFAGVFPIWIAYVLLIIVVTMVMFRWDIDMRGNDADAVGMVQRPVLIGINLIAFLWLLQLQGLLGTI